MRVTTRACKINAIYIYIYCLEWTNCCLNQNPELPGGHSFNLIVYRTSSLWCTPSPIFVERQQYCPNITNPRTIDCIISTQLWFALIEAGCFRLPWSVMWAGNGLLLLCCISVFSGCNNYLSLALLGVSYQYIITSSAWKQNMSLLFWIKDWHSATYHY